MAPLASAPASASASASARAHVPLLPARHPPPAGHGDVQPSALCAFGPRLAFAPFRNPIPEPDLLNHNNLSAYWFTIDSLLVYLSFFQDTGPLNCACLYRFCLHLHGLLQEQAHADKRIIMYCSEDPDKKANSALLMCLYCMVVLRWSPADALHPISHLEFQPFRDAGYAPADFNLSIQNVLFGVQKAVNLKLLRLDEFDLKEYETFEKVENGDYNWLSPHFIAFASPVELAGHGNRVSKSFRMILDQFEKMGVSLVVRLNKKLYDENRFKERGIAHKEMYFDDGTNPTMEMVREFIILSERTIKQGGVVAVHCKAGLGRTGTLIGAYLIYKYKFTAEEAIGFMRLMRPGTCVGPQQHFLYENQMTWIEWAARDELLVEQQGQISPSKTERPITPPPDSSTTPPVPLLTTPPPRTNHTCTTGMSAAVPGQPRKTPGAKTRHMVTAPESRPVGNSLIGQEEAREMIEEGPVVPAAEAKGLHRRGPAAPLHKAVASPVKSGLQPTAVPKPRPRPASALSDHRPGAAGLVRRSKAVKDLGTLFEGLSKTENGPMVNKQNANRYNLRGSGTRTGGGGSDKAGVNLSLGQQNVCNSASRLPQRVINRRRGGGLSINNPNHSSFTRKGAATDTELKGNQPPHRTTGGGGLAGTNQNAVLQPHHRSLRHHAQHEEITRKGLGIEARSVRRRRSSLSHTDVLM